MKEQYQSAKSFDNKFDRAAHIKKGVQSQKGNLDFGKTLKEDIYRDLKTIVSGYQSLTRGKAGKAGVNMSFGDYASRLYGIEKDKHGTMLPLLRTLGVNPYDTTIVGFGNSIKQNFSSVPEVDPTGSFEWLIGEYIADALRTALNIRGVYTQLIQSTEMIAFDSVKTPIIKNPNGFMKEVGEHESVKMGTIEFDEIATELIEVATGIKLSDKLMRNSTINIVSEYLAGAAGKNLDKQQTKLAIDTLINGNDLVGGTDAAPTVGVETIGAFDYDTDVLEIIIAMAELGYDGSTVLGSRNGIKQIMALPEFKGFDGMAKKADSMLYAAPLPSEYLFVPTGAMPTSTASAAKLLFLDPRFALKHYSSKPLTVESDRIIQNLRTEVVASMTTGFVKQYQDASILMDSGVSNVTNPFPAEFDSEVSDGTTF